MITPPRALRWTSILGLLVPIFVSATVLAIAGFVQAQGSSAAGSALIALDVDPATAGIQSSIALPLGTDPIQIGVVVQNADKIGAFEFQISFDHFATDFAGWTIGPFLGSTGRPVGCQMLSTENTVRVGCDTTGPPTPGGIDGPSGDGVLGTLSFHPKLPGGTCFSVTLVETATPLGDPLPTTSQDGCVTIPPPIPTPTVTGTVTSTATATPTASRTAMPRSTSTFTAVPATATRTPATPSVTATPGAATATNTPTSPTATNTPSACAHSPEYWRDHPADWPTGRLTLGHEEYGKDELLNLLKADPSGDASIALARELIASKLNAAAGRASGPPEASALADALLSEAGGRLPLGMPRSGYRGQGMLWVAGSLLNDNEYCESETRPITQSPTAVSTVLGSTRNRNPSELPGTGSGGPLGGAPTGAVVVLLTMVVGVGATLILRRTLSDRPDD